MSRGVKLSQYLNVWDKRNFQMSGFRGFLKCFARHIKWSYQRVSRGYSDSDLWDIYSFLQKLIPDMLERYKDRKHGSPSHLGQNVTNEDGFLDNLTCHEEWDKILDQMIFLWRESDEDTCTQKNEYEEDHEKAFLEFTDTYGVLGEKLQTEKEIQEGKKYNYRTVHFMSEIPKYKEIDRKYMDREDELRKYRIECKDKAMDMLKQYFFDLWD